MALCLEQTLGHRAHAANLTGALVATASDSVDVVEVTPDPGSRLPWALRGSWKAAAMLRRRAAHDVRFYHTQSVSLLAPFTSRGRPFVVSVDATPRQLDQMGRWYGHSSSGRPLEWFKERWYRLVFSRAAAVVAWSQWAADSLTNEYGVRAGKVSVIHPGAPAGMFQVERVQSDNSLPVVLFVGGDLQRKGGDMLLDVFQEFRGRARLVLVTTDRVEPADGVDVIADATPGSPRLIEAYRQADIFCLPTRGDCTPVVLGEAMAAGLPVVSTRIGSNSETVKADTGILIDVDDRAALSSALDRLIANPPERAAMGHAARNRAEMDFDAEKNAARIFDLLRAVAR